MPTFIRWQKVVQLAMEVLYSPGNVTSASIIVARHGTGYHHDDKAWRKDQVSKKTAAGTGPFSGQCAQYYRHRLCLVVFFGGE